MLTAIEWFGLLLPALFILLICLYDELDIEE